EGSVFTFSLPLAEDFSENPIAVKTVTQSMNMDEFSNKEIPMAMHEMMETLINNTPSSYRPRILAIDDDPVNLRVLRNILSEDQYEVEIVTSGKEALEQIGRENWDLVISDV